MLGFVPSNVDEIDMGSGAPGREGGRVVADQYWLLLHFGVWRVACTKYLMELNNVPTTRSRGTGESSIKSHAVASAVLSALRSSRVMEVCGILELILIQNERIKQIRHVECRTRTPPTSTDGLDVSETPGMRTSTAVQ